MAAPDKLFDAHFHIIDPRFPLRINQGYTPEAFLCQDYLARMGNYSLRGGAIVSGSFQGHDQGYLLAALQQLGTGFVGVTQLPHTTPEQALLHLHNAGVRAIRFNLKRGGGEQLAHMESLAAWVYERVGWHAEIYADGRQLQTLYSRLATLPAICIDHLGLDLVAQPYVLKLMEKGAYVKASGFGRLAPELDLAGTLKTLSHANPSALVFGSDLPGTRARRAFRGSDIRLLLDLLGESLAERVLYRNALALYRLAPD